MSIPNVTAASSEREKAKTTNALVRFANATPVLTLATSTTQTTLEHPGIGPNSVVLLTPTHSSSVGQSVYQGTTQTGSAIIHHATSTLATRTFRVLIAPGD